VLLILINAPPDVDQTSPLVGEVGAVPGIIRRLDTVVVDPKIFKFVLAEVAIPTPAKVSVGVVMVGDADSTTLVVPVDVVTPVPPFSTGRAVPEYVMASVPAPVIGLPEIENTLGTVAATLVTVPPDEGELLVTVKLG